MIEPAEVADAVIEGLAAERFLILPHPEVADYVQRKATDPDRWLAGMRRLQARFTGRRVVNLLDLGLRAGRAGPLPPTRQRALEGGDDRPARAGRLDRPPRREGRVPGRADATWSRCGPRDPAAGERWEPLADRANRVEQLDLF